MEEDKYCKECEISKSTLCCEICSKNLCEECVKKLTINLTGFKQALLPDQKQLGDIKLCEDCIHKAGRVNPSTLLDDNGFTKIDILTRLRKNFMVMSLEEENENEEENFVSQINNKRNVI